MVRLEVLLVEDNRADEELVKVMLDDTSIAHNISSVSNGEEALTYLKGEGRYAAVPKPDLIFLDLNMPRMNGEEFLAKAKALIEGIYVIVISGSPVIAVSEIPHRRLVKPGTAKEIDEAVGTIKEIMQQLVVKK
jgi:CheY-like chemotaxis protein